MPPLIISLQTYAREKAFAEVELKVSVTGMGSTQHFDLAAYILLHTLNSSCSHIYLLLIVKEDYKKHTHMASIIR